MTERRKFSLKYGSEISLLYEEETGFLSCPGGAHPKLALRPGNHLVELLSFENCVFIVHPPIDVSSASTSTAAAPGSTNFSGGDGQEGGILGDVQRAGGGSRGAAGGGAGGVQRAGGGSRGAAGGGAGGGHSTLAGGGGAKQYVLQTEVTYGAKFLLKHKQSGLFVSILTTQPSELDSDCHMVALIAEGEAAQTRSALFRFTPRFKVHNEGDFVCQGDSVLLQTFSHKLFLHVSELATAVFSGGGDLASRAGSTLTGIAQRAQPSRGGPGSLSPSTPSLFPHAPRSPSNPPVGMSQLHQLEVEPTGRHEPASSAGGEWKRGDLTVDCASLDSGLDHIDCQKVAAKGKPLVLLGTPVALFHRERESLLTSSVARTAVGSNRSESSNSTPPGTRAQTVIRNKSNNSARSSSGGSLETRRRGYQSMKNMSGSPALPFAADAAAAAAAAAGTSWRAPSPVSPGTSRVVSMAPSGMSADVVFGTAPPMGAAASAAGDLAGFDGVPHTVSPTYGTHHHNVSTAAMKNSASHLNHNSSTTPAVTTPSGVYPLLSPYTNGYLSNEFSFANLRCSCAAYWVFEQVDPTVGGPLRYGVPFRLRQAATNMYLAVVGNNMENMMSAQWQAPYSPGVSGFAGVSAAGGSGASAQTPLSQRGLGRPRTSGGSLRFRQDSNEMRLAEGTMDFTLALVPAPADEETQQRTLFVVEHTFYPEAKVVSETDFFRIQNVETGLWLCTDSDVTSRAEVTISLEFRPLAHDAFMTGHISEQAHRDVLHIFYNFDALQRYKNLFSHWWHQRLTGGIQLEDPTTSSKEESSATTGEMRLTPPSMMPSVSTQSFANTSFTSTSMKNYSGDFESEGLPPTAKSGASVGVSTFSTRPHLSVIRRCSEALTSLIYFCTASDDPDPLTREGLPIPDHQRMMFDLQLHRMVFDIIVAPLIPVTEQPRHQTIIDLGQSAHRLPKLPLGGGAVPKKQFDVKHPEFGVLHNISRLGFRLIKQMVMGNPSFAVLLAKYIPVMFELDGMKLHVVEVMHEIFTENDELPSTTIEAAVDHYVKTLVTKQRSAGYLKFLATMCALRNNTCGLVENQELVCRKLIIDRPKDSPVLLPTVLLPSGHVGVEFSSQEAPVSIESFLSGHKDSKLVKFFEGQIELFAKLSCGCGSKLCATTLEAHFPSLQLDGVVKTILWTGDEKAGRASKLDLTRCNLFRLAMNLYVHPVLKNNEMQLALNTILIGSSALRRKWDTRRDDVTFSHSSTKDTVIMSSIKHAAMQLLQANPYVVITDRPRNELIKTVLDVWCDFVIYRQYSTEELRLLMPLVIRLLDGTRDVASATTTSRQSSAATLSGSSGALLRAASTAQLRRSVSNATPLTGGANAGAPGAGGHRTSSPHNNNQFRVDPRRFLKTEDSFLVMEIRLSICQLLSQVLRNMIHDEGDEVIVEVFNALGGIQACGGVGGGVSGLSKVPSDKNAKEGGSADSTKKRASSFPGIFRRVASAFGLAKSVVDTVVVEESDGEDDDEEGGVDSTRQHHQHRVVQTVTMDNASSVTDALIQSKVRLISACFSPDELVPIILDTAQYNHPQLTTVSMNLLVDLCGIRRKLCENVLSVKLVPSREMLSQFDRLHGVAVEIATAVASGDVEEMVDAMEMVLKTLLNNYVPRNRLRQIGSTLGSLHSSGNFGSMRSPSPTNSSRDGSVSSPPATAATGAANAAAVRERSNSGRRRSVKFADGSDDDEVSPSPSSPTAAPAAPPVATAAPKPPRTAKIRWAEATTVAKLVAMSKRVQRKRNSLGLDPSSDVPLDVICRAELMCHWGIHLTLLDRLASGELTLTHPAYVDVMDFFYYFSLSPSNARQLSPYLELFITAIHHEDVRMQCMHVVVAVLSARALRSSQGKSSVGNLEVDNANTGGGDGGIDGKNVDVGVLQSLALMIQQEHQSREPDSSFLRLVNKHLLGDNRRTTEGGANSGGAQHHTAALSQTSSKQFVHLLHSRNVFQHLGEPKASRAAELQFNSSLVELLCGICRSNRSVRSLAQRIVTQAQLLATLSRKNRADMLPRVHQCPYYRLLAEVFFSRDEESEAERVKIMTLWNESSSWWALVKMIGRQYSDVATLQRKAAYDGIRLRASGSSAEEIIAEHTDEQKEASVGKDFWFLAVPTALSSFLTTTFSIQCIGVHRTEVVDAIKELAGGFVAFSGELSISTGLWTNMAMSDVVSIARCMRATEDALEALGDGLNSANQLRQQRRFQLQELVDELTKGSPGTSGDSSLRRTGSGGGSNSGSSNGDASASQYGNGSFFFQSDVRDMSDLEITVRRVFAKSAPRDVIISKHLLRCSDAAQCFVKYLTAMATPAPELTKDAILVARHAPTATNNTIAASVVISSSVSDELDERTPSSGSGNGLKVTRRTMESFVLKLLAHLAGLALPADTISGILNLVHATLVGVEFDDDLVTSIGVAASLLSQQPTHDSFGRRGSDSPSASNGLQRGDDSQSTTQTSDASSPKSSLTSVAATKSDVITAELEHRKLVARQNHFDQLGLMRVVTGLSDLSDPTVTKSALEVGIALLEGGNTTVQNHMLQYFETHDESFFHNVKEILQSCMERVQSYNEWLLQQLLEKNGANASIGDGYGGSALTPPSGGSGSQHPSSLTTRQRSMLSLTSFLGNSSSATSRSPAQSFYTTLPASSSTSAAAAAATPRYPGANPFLYIAETFRFLQLMCEGHHHGMQNYIRVQSDNLHSINVLQEVLLLIVELTAIQVDNSNVTVLRKGLELLTEFCQGPCVENQSTLLQNDICSLLSMILQLQPSGDVFALGGSGVAGGGYRPGTVSPGDPQSTAGGAAIDRDKLMELQHAASVTLLALTEGSSRPEVFQKVLSQIPLTIVERLVKSIVSSPSTTTTLTDAAHHHHHNALTKKHSDVTPPSALMARKDSKELDDKQNGDAATGSGTLAPQEDDDDASSSSSSDEDGNDSDDEDNGPTEDLLFNLLIFTKSVTAFLERSHDHVALDLSRQVFSYVPNIAKRLGSIQVERNGVVERVYFPIPEICLSLTQKSKDEVLWSVDRTSRLTKLNDFFQKIDELMFEMNSVHRFARRFESWTRLNLSGSDSSPHHGVTSEPPSLPTTTDVSSSGQFESFASASGNASLKRRFRSLSLLDRLRFTWNESVCRYICRSDPEYYENVALLLAVIINVLFVCTDGVDQEEHNTTLIEWFVTGLVVLQTLLYMLVFTMDTLVFLPVYYYRGYRRQLRAAGIVVSTQKVSQDDVMRSMPSIRRRLLIAMRRFTTTYYLALILASLCALFIDPYFAAIHLLGLINKSASLRTVIVAITQNGKSLLLTMGLGVIVVYMFSIMGYMYFPSAFGGGDERTSATISENCQTLGRCFMFILTNGLRQGGGVGDLMDKASWDSPMLFHRMGYDFAFYALVNVVFLNILFGIIIDTFAELRDDKRRKEEDMNTCCFICGLDAEVFEKEGGGFKRHVHRDHNMWQYLYFIYYLRLKDPNDFNGQESFVYREMVRGSLGFLPDGKCLSLVNKFGDGNVDSSDPSSSSSAAKPSGDDSDDAPTAAAKNNGPQAASAAVLAGSVATAMKADMDALREHISTALRDVGTEVSQLRTAAAAVTGGGGSALPDLMASSTAPTFGSGDNSSFMPSHLLRSGSPAGAIRGRRRSKSMGGPNIVGAAAGLDSSLNGAGGGGGGAVGDFLDHTVDSDGAVTALHAQIANLHQDLQGERERVSALQIQLFESRSATAAAEGERDELAEEIRIMLEKTLSASSPANATKAPLNATSKVADVTSLPESTNLSNKVHNGSGVPVMDALASSTTTTTATKALLRSLSTSIEGLLQNQQLRLPPMLGTPLSGAARHATAHPTMSITQPRPDLMFNLDGVAMEKSMHTFEHSPSSALVGPSAFTTPKTSIAQQQHDDDGGLGGVAVRSPPTTSEEALSPSEATEHVSPSPPSRMVSFRFDRDQNQQNTGHPNNNSIAESSHTDLRRLASMVSAASTTLTMNTDGITTMGRSTAVSTTSRCVQTDAEDSSTTTTANSRSNVMMLVSNQPSSSVFAAVSPGDDEFGSWTPSASVPISHLTSRADLQLEDLVPNAYIRSRRDSSNAAVQLALETPIAKRFEIRTKEAAVSAAPGPSTVTVVRHDASTQADSEVIQRLKSKLLILQMEYRKLLETSDIYLADCRTYSKATDYFLNERAERQQREKALRRRVGELERNTVAVCEEKMWDLVRILREKGVIMPGY
ncbi:transmembrane protein, putative [Bodo saltans]|uniref:Transmembrane protein, putative n=1 Tax=Bodo saltans TaxID=75058 RepID=A0A0S4JGF0_BODSA|nr:transmembrane protein, putative [Bodo saltans]|eukprot:CUG89031.1 transmembrane protein, putative [Bodo saltans]